MTYYRARSAECRMPSVKTAEERLAAKLKHYHEDEIVLIHLKPLDETDRKLAERIFLDQTDRERREIQVMSNIERIR